MITREIKQHVDIIGDAIFMFVNDGPCNGKCNIAFQTTVIIRTVFPKEQNWYNSDINQGCKGLCTCIVHHRGQIR